MDRYAIEKALLKVVAADNIGDDYKLLMAVLYAMHNPCVEALHRLTGEAQAHLEAGYSLPIEVQQYLLDKLLIAADKEPGALGLNRVVDIHKKRSQLVEEICAKAYEYRHQPDPVVSAIKVMFSCDELGVSVEYAQKLYRPRRLGTWYRLAAKERKGSSRLKFYKEQICSDPSRVASMMIETLG